MLLTKCMNVVSLSFRLIGKPQEMRLGSVAKIIRKYDDTKFVRPRMQPRNQAHNGGGSSNATAGGPQPRLNFNELTQLGRMRLWVSASRMQRIWEMRGMRIPALPPKIRTRLSLTRRIMPRMLTGRTTRRKYQE